MSIADKLTTVAENVPKVYAAGQSSMVDESKIIEKTVSGALISVDDVSEIPHSVGCKVSGVDDPTSVKVTRCGKNLIDKSKLSKSITSGGITATLNDDGSFTLNGTSTVGSIAFPYYPSIKLVKGKTYTLGGGINSNIFIQGKYEEIDNFSSYSYSDARTFIAGGNYTLRFNIRVMTVGTVLDNVTVYPMLELGSTATDYEPYTSTEYTPNADGTVEGMTSLSPYMNVFTDNAEATLDVTYRKSWGMQTEYDRFWNEIWDAIQFGGTRTNYNGFFKFEYWNEKTFRPKYDMRLTGNNSGMFDRFGGEAKTTTKSIDLAQIFEDCGVVLDTSKSTSLNNMFYFSSISRVPAISAVGCTSKLIGVFALCIELETVDKFILKEDGSDKLKEVFLKDISLRNIIIEGTMGDSVSFEWCPLSKESILSVFNALSSTATGLTLTLNLAAVNTAFETSEGAADGSTSEEWATLIATKPNWTISLV